MKILVVDDEPIIQTLANKILTRDGHDVIIAQSGTEALERYNENSEDIALIILDYNLKDIDGITVLGKLREINPELPCVFSSGQIIPELSLPLAQNTHTLQKPYRAAQLTELVQQIMGNR